MMDVRLALPAQRGWCGQGLIQKQRRKKMTESYTQEWHCPVCGKIVEQSGKGRPKEYHERCRKLNNLMTFMETEVSNWPEEERNTVTKRFIKSNLQRIANHTSTKEWSK
jgi:hypothetical protein